MTTTIFIVVGATGDYEDHHEWNVRGFRDRPKAEALEASAQARGMALDAEVGKLSTEQWLGSNEFDVEWEPRTRYSINECELEE